MLGAIIGDMVGHPFEFKFEKAEGFPLFSKDSGPTDDTYMTLAIARALFLNRDNLDDIDKLKKTAIKQMRDIANDHRDTQWGERFYRWLFEGGSANYSCGNGAGMRISPVGWVADSEEQVKILSKALTEISHTHPEALIGAECIAMCVYLARIGKSKEYIRDYVVEHYYPRIKNLSYDWIWSTYEADDNGYYVTCQGSIPESVVAFLDSTDFEDAIRKAIKYGGDTDTQACMTGAIAEAYYGVPLELEDKMLEHLPSDLISTYYSFDTIKKKRVKK